MNQTTVFDVIVVYIDTIATSASAKKSDKDVPFLKHIDYNDAYGYFLETCAKNNLKAAFTTSADIIGAGFFRSYWLFENKQWTRVHEQCSSQLIFDKFSPITKKQKDKRATLFGNPKIAPFNSPDLFSLFFDKQKTYDRLKKFSIPTVAIENNSKEGIEKAIAALKNLVSLHPEIDDFSEKIVIKDRFGAGGNKIYRISEKNQVKKIVAILENHKKTQFILQPFTQFENGYQYKSYSGFIDIRIIYLKEKVLQVFIRTAKKNDFRCNLHQGGKVIYTSEKELPTKVLILANKIMNMLQEKNALYALDFIISNNGNAYLIEGNSGPGLNWDFSDKEDEKMTKQLINAIVMELARRVTPIVVHPKFPAAIIRKNLLFPFVIPQVV